MLRVYPAAGAGLKLGYFPAELPSPSDQLVTSGLDLPAVAGGRGNEAGIAVRGSAGLAVAGSDPGGNGAEERQKRITFQWIMF